MSAHDQIRAMLDQLMGTSRNGEEEKLAIKFDDARVCKSFLLGCCPHEILASTSHPSPASFRVNTVVSHLAMVNLYKKYQNPMAQARMDLGDCAKLHNLALKADYEIASPNKDYFYDLDALEQLSIFVAEADRKTEQARKRLAETQEELSGEVSGKADRVHELGEKIGEALARAEALGAEGLVDESIKLMEEIDALRKQKAEAESDYRSSIPAATYQQQKLRVCEVCCAYLGIHDNDRRLADHFGGKLHLGFIKIRETLKEYQDVAEDRRRKRREQMRLDRLEEEERNRKREREERDKERERKSGSRDKSTGREDRERDRRGGGGGGGRDRDRDKDKKRSRRSKSRSRSKDRDRKKRSSRSRSPRDRDRKRSHKDKERKRSRSKERSRSHRSRSRSPRADRKSRHSHSDPSRRKEPQVDKSPSPPPVLSAQEINVANRNSSISEEESGEI